MDQEQLSYLTDQQKERWQILENLFAHPGWNLIVQFLEIEAENQNIRAANAASWDENRLAVGARAAYAQLAKLAESTEHEFALLAEQAREAALAEDEGDFE